EPEMNSPPPSPHSSPPDAAPTNAQATVSLVCPNLGYADDRENHYSRPIQLHRCFANDRPSLVTIQEQRALCLTPAISACPRFATPQASDPAPPAPVIDAQPGSTDQPDPQPKRGDKPGSRAANLPR